jgi:hypothetical protein
MIDEFRHGLLHRFAGRPVFDFDFDEPGELEEGAVPAEIEDWAWRLPSGRDERDLHTGLGQLVAAVEPSRIRALISGAVYAGHTTPATGQTAALLDYADRLCGLEALFLGDVTPDQCEVSWLDQQDPGPLLAAFPRLREFGLRGTSELSSIEPLEHDTLEELTFQGGGLAPAVVRAIGASRLPALTGLELYLGTADYNGGAEPADLAAILDGGGAFPRLRHLALRDAENADEIAAALAHAPIVAQLDTLDLSLGALGDEGAAALLAGQPLTHLKRLDLHHHFLTDAMMQRLWAALPGVEVNLDEQQEAGQDADEAEFWRYIAVSE